MTQLSRRFAVNFEDPNGLGLMKLDLAVLRRLPSQLEIPVAAVRHRANVAGTINVAV
jgi:hypothetical protein